MCLLYDSGLDYYSNSKLFLFCYVLFFFPLALCTGQGAAHFFVCFLASVEPTCWFCFLTFLFIVRKFAEWAIVLDLPHVLHLGGEKLGKATNFHLCSGEISACVFIDIFIYLFIYSLLVNGVVILNSSPLLTWF